MAKATLTIREQVALRAYVESLCDGKRISPSDVYRAAYSGSLQDAESLADLPANATRWLQGRRVVDFIAERQAVVRAQREAERERILSEARAALAAEAAGALTATGEVDYTDPRNVLRKLNTIISTSKDPGEQLDAIRLLLQRQSELAPASRAQRNDVQRFYVPINCKTCPLYNNHKK